MGRHPIQNPPIKPEIGKLSQSIVDQIPLVLYVPAHKDDDEGDEEDNEKKEGNEKDVTDAYSYPPKNPSKLKNKEKGKEKRKKKRFTFLRKAFLKTSGSKSGKSGDGEGDGEGEGSWEDDWEKGEYPFVRMEGHRATCAICLMDFDEPPRVRKGRGKQNLQGNLESKVKSLIEGDKDEQEQEREQESGVVGDVVASTSGVEEVQVEEVSDEERLQLEGVGQGPQPLRLLPCGHAFHVSTHSQFPFLLPPLPLPLSLSLITFFLFQLSRNRKRALTRG